MKKIFCDNWLAKILLCMTSCHTITIGPFVLSKRKEERITQETRNHECTHARQWIEMAVLSGLLIWIGMLIFGYSAWWLIIAGVAFYIWYGIEWFIRLILYIGKDKRAYNYVSFEREAYVNQTNPNYLENSNYFAWLWYI